MSSKHNKNAGVTEKKKKRYCQPKKPRAEKKGSLTCKLARGFSSDPMRPRLLR